MINKIDFKDVTILYNDKYINKKLCKKKNRQINLLTILIGLIMIITVLGVSGILFYLAQNISIILSLIILIGIPLGFGIGYIWLIDKLTYHNTIKAYSFIEWMFRMKDVYVDWYKGELLFIVRHSYGTDDYRLQGFLGNIKNELLVNDKSEKGKPIHVTIDVTNDSKTEVLITNK